MSRWWCVLLLLVGWPAMPVAGRPADPQRIFSYRQPDGVSFAVRLYGDERLMFRETAAGHTILQDARDGYWYYASTDGGTLVATTQRADDSPPAGLPRHLRPTATTAPVLPPGMQGAPRLLAAPRPIFAPRPAAAPGANGRLLVILCEWSGAGPLNTVTLAAYSNLFNSAGYNGVGSVHDYYNEVSYGRFNFAATVTGNAAGNDWLDVTTMAGGNTYAYFVNNAQGMGAYPQNSQGLVEAVVKAVDPLVDFSPFDTDGDGKVDGVAVIFAGDADGSNGKFWPHAWGLGTGGHEYTTGDGVVVDAYYVSSEVESSGTAEIGTHCHEYGHVLGLPDLYDYTYTSNGVGYYDLMGLGNSLGAVDGRQPAQLSAWSKKQLGWLAPTVATFGEQTLAQVENTAAAVQVPATLNNTTEYFLVENRQQTGFDALLPGSGLLIYHIDESVYAARPDGPNDDRTHKAVDVECADGLDAQGFDDLDNLANNGDANDYWRLGYKTVFDGASSPNTNMYDGHATGISFSAISATGATMTFKLSTPFTSQVSDRRALAYPNPFNLSISATVRLRTEPVVEARRMRICTLRGEVVREFGQADIGTDGIVDWDGRTASGGRVASGSYLLIITDSSGGETVGHFTLVK